MTHMTRIADLLNRIYGPSKGQAAWTRIHGLMADFAAASPSTPAGYPDEKEIVLITYGDTLRRADQVPLKTLQNII